MYTRLKELLFKNRGTRQTFLKNTFWLSLGEVGSRLLRAIVVIYAARALGAAQYGVFSYLVGLAGFFTIFADIGIRQIMIRGVSQHPSRSDEYFATAFWLKIGLLALTSLIIIFAAPHFSKIPEAAALLPLVALLTVFDNLREFSAGYFRGKEQMQFETLITFVTNGAILLFGFVILFFAPTALAFTVTYVLAAGSGAILGVVLLRQRFAKVLSHFNLRLAAPLLRAAWPIALMGSLGAFMLNIDIVMLGFYRDAEAIGLYAAGQKIIQLLYIFPTIIAASAFPVFSRFVKEKSAAESRALFEKILRIICLVAIPLSAGGLAIAPSVIRFLYGAAYVPAIPAFRILLLTPLLLFPGVIMSNFILAHDKQKRIAPFVILASAGNVVFNLLFIPPLGIAGAALATIGAQLLYNGGVYAIAKRLTPFTFTKRLSIPLTAALVMGVCAVILQVFGLNAVLNILFSLAVYLGMLHLLGEDLLRELVQILKRRSSGRTTGKA